MRGYKPVAAVAALISVLAVAVGCGSSGDTASSAASTKAEFVKKANTICKEAVESIQADGSRIYREESTGKAGEEAIFAKRVVHEVLVPNFEKEMQGIQALEAPPGDKAQVAAILTSIRDVIDQLEHHLSPKVYPYNKAEAAADSYGLTACGRPSTV